MPRHGAGPAAPRLAALMAGCCLAQTAEQTPCLGYSNTLAQREAPSVFEAMALPVVLVALHGPESSSQAAKLDPSTAQPSRRLENIGTMHRAARRRRFEMVKGANSGAHEGW